jgi:hypothetical protein
VIDWLWAERLGFDSREILGILFVILSRSGGARPASDAVCTGIYSPRGEACVSIGLEFQGLECVEINLDASYTSSWRGAQWKVYVNRTPQYFIFGRSSVWLFVWRPDILIEVICGFCQSLQKLWNNWPRSLCVTSFPIHQFQFSLHSCNWESIVKKHRYVETGCLRVGVPY